MPSSMSSSWSLLTISLLLSFFTFTFAADAPLPKVNISRTINLRTHSLYAPYIDQDLQNRWWDFGADAYVNTAKYVRLTRNRPSETGWLWSRLPISANNFQIELEFKIGGDSTHLFGDGIAFWLSTTRAQSGPVFGSVDNFEGLGIFIDTYANARHSYSFPRIMAMAGDGKTSYDLGNDGESNSVGACSANVRRTNVATKVRLTYIKNRYLDVELQYKAWDDWTHCFRIDNLKLPVNPYMGVTSITGDVFDSHDVIAITTSTVVLADKDATRAGPQKKGKSGRGSSSGDSEGGSWAWFLVKLIAFIGVAAALYVGWQKRNGGGRSGYGAGGGFGTGMGSQYFQSGKRF